MVSTSGLSICPKIVVRRHLTILHSDVVLQHILCQMQVMIFPIQRPVITISLFFGNSISISFKLCALAPLTTILDLSFNNHPSAFSSNISLNSVALSKSKSLAAFSFLFNIFNCFLTLFLCHFLRYFSLLFFICVIIIHCSTNDVMYFLLIVLE